MYKTKQENLTASKHAYRNLNTKHKERNDKRAGKYDVLIQSFNLFWTYCTTSWGDL